MYRISRPISSLSSERSWTTSRLDRASPEPMVNITDERVFKLLTVLQELDQSVAGLEELPKDELSELVSDAIRACGFLEPEEAQYAIAAVLETIETPGSMPGYS
jgi:hypothetical protein